MSKLIDYFQNVERIELADGRLLSLKRIHQTLTYGNQLEGLPGRDEQALERHRAWFEKKNGRTILLDARPVPLPLTEEEKDFYRNHRVRSFNTHPFTSLAPVQCIAKFESDHVPGGDGYDISKLNMIWYQEKYAMPIAPEIMDKLRVFDWDGYAVNEPLL